MSFDDRAIAVSATFTAEAIQPALAFWAGEVNLDYRIRFAPYNTLFQQLLDPAGLFAANRGGVNVALVRFEDWLAAGVEEQVGQLIAALRTAASYPAPLILAVCPPTPARNGRFQSAERTLREALADLPGAHLLLPADVEALYPVPEIHDPHANELGHLPYTPAFFAALATAIARRIHAIVTPPFKVVALDCDETLWAGICGEDGPQGVALDPPRRVLQEFMAERLRAGMLLALCSKNNEQDVLDTFRAHPEMPLGIRDFAARCIDWESKGANLARLAAELELGLDAFILVDDSSKECAEAVSGAPEILALPLPGRPAEIPEFLKHVWAFDRARITEEDRRRPELYAQRAERTRAARQAASLEEFLAGLQLEIAIAPVEPAQVPRVAQLTQRTNQMNANLVRRTEPEIQALLAGGAECLAVEVKDRFGAYGLTGVVIFSARGPVLAVDTFLLSCRALGRGVEHRMVAGLGELALRRGLERVEIPFVAGQRNRPAALFLESLRPPGPDGVFRIPAAEAAAVRYRAGAGVVPPGQARPDSAAAQPQPSKLPPRRPDYIRIATELRDPHAVLMRIKAGTRRRPQSAEPEPPRTPLERDLAALWAGLLNLPVVGVHDNFFELGGHSLLAVQLLSRIRQVYGVELSLEVVYSGDFTVAELAKAIELKEIESAGGDYHELLAELDSLSDEEVRELLAEEQDAP